MHDPGRSGSDRPGQRQASAELGRIELGDDLIDLRFGEVADDVVEVVVPLEQRDDDEQVRGGVGPRRGAANSALESPDRADELGQGRVLPAPGNSSRATSPDARAGGMAREPRVSKRNRIEHHRDVPRG